MKFFIRCFVLGCLVSCLCACGYHLKGVTHYPPELQALYLEPNTANHEFSREMEQLLRKTHVHLVNSRQEARAVLTIVEVQTHQQMTALNGGGQAGQYSLSTTVTFSLVNPKTGLPLIANTSVERSRLFDSNATQALSAQATIDQLMGALSEEIALEILDQLSKFRSPVS